MTTKLISPSQIESELTHIWDSFPGTKKMRASLFNLIFYTHKKARVEYIHTIAQKVIEKFPARILFITVDPNLTAMETRVSVIPVSKGEYDIACDYIQLDVAESEKERIPFVILPHLLPDLPIYIVWAEDPSKSDPIFSHFEQIATRFIFDSESTENLIKFSDTLLNIHQKTQLPIADLNWARMESWRDLLSVTFYQQERLEFLKKAKTLQIFYNAKESSFYCHTAIQSIYLQGWLACQMGWTLDKQTMDGDKCRLIFKKSKDQVIVDLIAEKHEHLPSGTIVSVELDCEEAHFSFGCDLEIPHQISMRFSTSDRCEIPLKFIFSKAESGQSLVKEISHKGISTHYLKLLQLLKTMPLFIK